MYIELAESFFDHVNVLNMYTEHVKALCANNVVNKNRCTNASTSDQFGFLPKL